MSADPQIAFLAHAYFITREGQGKLALQLLWKKKKVETNSRRMAGDKIACHYYENRINIQKALETAPLLYEKRKKLKAQISTTFLNNHGCELHKSHVTSTPKKKFKEKPFKSGV